MVFQDPYASLNPRLRAGTIVGEPLENFSELSSADRRDRIAVVTEPDDVQGERARQNPAPACSATRSSWSTAAGR